jgi:hypothetical protein
VVSNATLVGTGRSAICVAYVGRFCCFIAFNPYILRLRRWNGSSINSPLLHLTLFKCAYKSFMFNLMLMSDAMTGKNHRKRGWMRQLGHASVCTALAALPLCGLVCFFELTRPLNPSVQGLAAPTLLSGAETASVGSLSFSTPVSFLGVSAERRTPSESASRFVSTGEAEHVLASLASSTLFPGFESEFVSEEGRRIALRIISRDPVGDQIISGQESTIAATPASTSKQVTFTWGPWLFRAELEDKGLDNRVVVPKVL